MSGAFFDFLQNDPNADLIFSVMTICEHRDLYPDEYETIKAALN